MGKKQDMFVYPVATMIKSSPYDHEIRDADGRLIARVPNGSDHDKDRALFIVRAINSHNTLVKICGELIDQVAYLREHLSSKSQQFTSPTTEKTVKEARAALALARKETK